MCLSNLFGGNGGCSWLLFIIIIVLLCSDDCCDNRNNGCGCGCGCGGTSFRPTTMTARVLEVQCCSLLVCDCDTCQQVQVNTDDACCYRVGDCLCIHYNGAMTNSLPPQISATCIHRR